LSDGNKLARCLRERVYLHNITSKTREHHETASKAFLRSQTTAPPRAPDAPVLTRADIQHGGDVVRLSIILGHSEVSTTMKYLRAGAESFGCERRITAHLPFNWGPEWVCQM
jgi:hypothetical protein